MLLTLSHDRNCGVAFVPILGGDLDLVQLIVNKAPLTEDYLSLELVFDAAKR